MPHHRQRQKHNVRAAQRPQKPSGVPRPRRRERGKKHKKEQTHDSTTTRAVDHTALSSVRRLRREPAVVGRAASISYDSAASFAEEVEDDHGVDVEDELEQKEQLGDDERHAAVDEIALDEADFMMAQQKGIELRELPASDDDLLAGLKKHHTSSSRRDRSRTTRARQSGADDVLVERSRDSDYDRNSADEGMASISSHEDVAEPGMQNENTAAIDSDEHGNAVAAREDSFYVDDRNEQADEHEQDEDAGPGAAYFVEDSDSKVAGEGDERKRSAGNRRHRSQHEDSSPYDSAEDENDEEVEDVAESESHTGSHDDADTVMVRSEDHDDDDEERRHADYIDHEQEPAFHILDREQDDNDDSPAARRSVEPTAAAGEKDAAYLETEAGMKAKEGKEQAAAASSSTTNKQTTSEAAQSAKASGTDVNATVTLGEVPSGSKMMRSLVYHTLWNASSSSSISTTFFTDATCEKVQETMTPVVSSFPVGECQERSFLQNNDTMQEVYFAMKVNYCHGNRLDYELFSHGSCAFAPDMSLSIDPTTGPCVPIGESLYAKFVCADSATMHLPTSIADSRLLSWKSNTKFEEKEAFHGHIYWCTDQRNLQGCYAHPGYRAGTGNTSLVAATVVDPDSVLSVKVPSVDYIDEENNGVIPRVQVCPGVVGTEGVDGQYQMGISPSSARSLCPVRGSVGPNKLVFQGWTFKPEGVVRYPSESAYKDPTTCDLKVSLYSNRYLLDTDDNVVARGEVRIAENGYVIDMRETDMPRPEDLKYKFILEPSHRFLSVERGGKTHVANENNNLYWVIRVSCVKPPGGVFNQDDKDLVAWSDENMHGCNNYLCAEDLKADTDFRGIKTCSSKLDASKFIILPHDVSTIAKLYKNQMQQIRCLDQISIPPQFTVSPQANMSSLARLAGGNGYVGATSPLKSIDDEHSAAFKSWLLVLGIMTSLIAIGLWFFWVTFKHEHHSMYERKRALREPTNLPGLEYLRDDIYDGHITDASSSSSGTDVEGPGGNPPDHSRPDDTHLPGESDDEESLLDFGGSPDADQPNNSGGKQSFSLGGAGGAARASGDEAQAEGTETRTVRPLGGSIVTGSDRNPDRNAANGAGVAAATGEARGSMQRGGSSSSSTRIKLEPKDPTKALLHKPSLVNAVSEDCQIPEGYYRTSAGLLKMKPVPLSAFPSRRRPEDEEMDPRGAPSNRGSKNTESQQHPVLTTLVRSAPKEPGEHMYPHANRGLLGEAIGTRHEGIERARFVQKSELDKQFERFTGLPTQGWGESFVPFERVPSHQSVLMDSEESGEVARETHLAKAEKSYRGSEKEKAMLASGASAAHAEIGHYDEHEQRHNVHHASTDNVVRVRHPDAAYHESEWDKMPLLF
mmetsp:Transcript_9209/g.22588  ORF Transcript_9209/g.22588 Transcript_9209/m.22588 type:complete len:1370 (+) Transcript_9209:962-5071(+)